MGGMAITPLSPASLGAANGRRQETNGAQGKSLPGQTELSPQQQAAVRQLETADREVRQHEQAHLAAAGGYARSGASYMYTTGPDGKRYATGGEVSIDVSTARTPQATIQKMETVKRAAVAPSNPSAQDRAVYAEAQQIEIQAQQEATQESRKQGTGGTGVAGANRAGLAAFQSAASVNRLGQNIDIAV